MSTKRGKNKFKISEPIDQLDKSVNSLSKYKLGVEGKSFHFIKAMKPIFAFDYLSLESSEICFDNKVLVKDDFVGFFEGLKKISAKTYDEMKRNPYYRFHSIDLFDPKVDLQPRRLRKILAPSGKGLTENELPTLYQFDLQYKSAARAVGFLYMGVFYIVWYDRYHKIYPQK